MRILKKLTLILPVSAVLLLLFYNLYIKPRHVIPILMYHAVSFKQDDTLHVNPENFSKQIEFLNRGGYSVISLDELIRGIETRKKFPSKTVVITFDDGFENNFLYAFPVLAKYNMPATIFLITDYMGTHDGYLNWDQINLMAENNIDFGGHTRSNVYLPSLNNAEKLWDEVSGCRFDIEKETEVEVKYFCYPIGGFNEKVKNAVKKAGYKAACTTNRGFDRYNRDIYELKRVKITNSDEVKPLHFRAKLSGYYNLFRSQKNGD
ncbi:MAG: polysaccharide deacetylase family protein [Candidatus Omnitrophica bacterium]|nr:polysaccharide deacetylase family protein [Candidatus Omnitrophota bacterium]